MSALEKLKKQIYLKRKGGRHLIGISGREIETRGLADGFWTDLYHRSMTVSWPTFFATAAAIFVFLNAVFACLYWLGNDPIANVAANGPLGFFYFSVETLATVGYGDMHPQTNYGHLMATIEIFTGMSFLAVMFGLIFSRFSRPRALHLRQPSCGDHTRGPPDADDPHRQRAQQYDLAGDGAAVAHSHGDDRRGHPVSPLLRAVARSP